MRFLGRKIVWSLIAIAVPVAAGLTLGRLGALIGIGIAVLASLWLWLWLPRMAHAAFESGDFITAARWYRMLHASATSQGRERAALLSLVGCRVASNRHADAEALLGAIDVATLDAAARAVWLNNRACALLDRDPHAALLLVDEATALRPDVPTLQHTRGMALLAVGRVDDAIAILDGMRGGGELAPRLEAERCRELSRAWAQKGEAAYAEDYRMRADALGR